MSKDVFTRRLRPYLFSGFKRSQCPRPARAFSSSRCLYADEKQRDVTHDYEKRVAQLQAHKPLSECYPRAQKLDARQGTGKKSFESEYGHLKPDETAAEVQMNFKGKYY